MTSFPVSKLGVTTKTPLESVRKIECPDTGKMLTIVPGIKPETFVCLTNGPQLWRVVPELGIMYCLFSVTHTQGLIASCLPGTVLGIQNTR